MPAAERLNDINDATPAPGAITKVVQSTVFVNGLLLSVNGSEVSPHSGGEPHEDPPPKTANGSSNVFAGNKPANRVGDADTCGHKRKVGSSNVFIN